MSVAAAVRSPGYAYTVVVHLRETAGVAATIGAVDLTFVAGSATMVTGHHEQPASNPCAANGTVDTRELVTIDSDTTHAIATRVQAIVTFTDGKGWTGTTSGTADVPPLSPPPSPQTYTLTGVTTDADTHRTIANANIEVLTGSNVGKTATTDPSGTYVLSGLVAGSIRLRASAENYASGEQSVTVPDVPRADFELRHNAYTLTGVITDAGTHAGIAGARVEALNGPNAGKAATTNATGTYVMNDVVAGTSRMRASATGYDSGEQNVTIPDNSRADFDLHPVTAAPCSYLVNAGESDLRYDSYAYADSLFITRTAGDCGWHATINVGWMTIFPTSGNGSGKMGTSVQGNPTTSMRYGVLDVQWAGGGFTIHVRQAGRNVITATGVWNGTAYQFSGPFEVLGAGPIDATGYVNGFTGPMRMALLGFNYISTCNEQYLPTPLPRGPVMTPPTITAHWDSVPKGMYCLNIVADAPSPPPAPPYSFTATITYPGSGPWWGQTKR